MGQGNVPMANLYDALKAAADTHKKYTVFLKFLDWIMEESVQVACMSGAGMDRHILAWKLIAAENNLPVPSITETEAYKHMTHFQVSTSQVRFLTLR